MAALCGAAILLALATPRAEAARIHRLLSSTTLPPDSNGNLPVLFGIATDRSTHRIYVPSIYNNSTQPTYILDGNGSLDEATPQLTGGVPSGQFRPAVDNSGGPATGDIYVVTQAPSLLESGYVQQFDPAGAATSQRITKASVPANGTPQTEGRPSVVNNGAFHPTAVAVDDEGHVFVVDAGGNEPQSESTRSIDEFTESGAFVAQLAAGKVSGTNGIALDSSGHIFISSFGIYGLGTGLFELDAKTGECIPVGCAPIESEPVSGVAVDDAEGTVLATGQRGANEEGWIKEFDIGTRELVGTTQPPELFAPSAIAVDEGNGHVIVDADLPFSERGVKIFGAVEVVPDVEIEAPEDVDDESALLKGRIGAAEVPEATCVFQYVEAEAFAKRGFEEAAEAPCEPAGPFTGSAMNGVEAHLTGLVGGVTYHVRLLGRNENGSNPTESEEFTTFGPTVMGTEAVEVDETAATFVGSVDPNGSATTYRFQYLTEAQFEAGGWSGATEVPPGGEDIGAGNTPLQLSGRIEGLASGTAYRLRILAESAAGVTKGQEITFVAFGPSPSLPDNRRYEQVSPVAKGGSSVQGEPNAVAASADGERVTFFSQAGIPGGEGEQNYPSYLSTWAGGSWSTQGLLPPASAGRWASVVGWTEDLHQVYDFASSTTDGTKLLLRSSEGGALTRIAGSEATTSSNPFDLAGSAADGSVALLESREGGILPGDRVGKQNVYVYGRTSGTFALAGVMNDGSVPPGGTMAGPYDWYTTGSPSQLGGALDRYYTQAEHAISADGTKVFFTAGETGQLYVRMNPLSAPQELGTEACLKGQAACTVRISAPESGVIDPGTPAGFVGASADGSIAYFVDKGKLTEGASGGSGFNLYRYELQSGRLTDLTVDDADQNGARVTGVLGVSASGQDVYFVAIGGLAGAGQAPAGETNLYELHGDTIHLITRLANATEESRNWIPRSSLGGGGLLTTNSARLSRDGQTLLFRAQQQLTSYRNDGVAELYLYRSGQGIDCVSCNPTGEKPSGPAGVQEIPGGTFPIAQPAAILSRNLSSDGRRVIFDSADQLVAADENGANDVYEWEADGKGSCQSEAEGGGCIYLISGGKKGAGASYLADADEEGENIFFLTGQALVAQDKDELVDVYDARVNGGIAAQEAVPPVPCEGEAGCLGGVANGPEPTGAGTSSFQGPGNPKPPTLCKKGQVRKGGKCVKKKSKRKAHHHKKKKKKGNGGGKHKNGGAHNKRAKKGGNR
jgi:hypothetical protein